MSDSTQAEPMAIEDQDEGTEVVAAEEDDLDDLDNMDFMLDEIENRIAPLA